MKGSRLFEPLTLRDHTFANRLWVAPMCQYSAVNGTPQDWHLVHLGGFAVGGAGLVIAEATAVSPEGRITPGCAGIWNDDQAEAWEPIARFVRTHGTHPGIQIAHAGRKGSTPRLWEPQRSVPLAAGGWETVAPSADPYGDLTRPAALSVDEIGRVVTDFGDAAARAEGVGFSVVEIHAAHGYLLHEFLSPLSNRRTDAYGGPFDNRIRLLLEVVDEVRRRIHDGTPVFVRLSATDWVDGGWTVEETAELGTVLEGRGVDLLDISSAGLDPRQQIPVGPGYQVGLSAKVRDRVTIPVGAVGLLTTPREFEDVLERGDADVVLVGREFLRDRMLPRRAAAELGSESVWPPQYAMARFAGSIP